MGLGEDILAAVDLPTLAVDLPLWGPSGTFFVRSMTQDEREQYELDCYNRTKDNADISSMLGAKAFLVALTLTDAQGNRVFSAEQVGALGAKSAKMLAIASTAASKHNGLTQADVEDLEKN